MERADKDLAFMLRYENVAWYEDGKVKILDRRIYPTETVFVTCTNHEEVAKAIKDMVTKVQDHIQLQEWVWHWQPMNVRIYQKKNKKKIFKGCSI